MDTVERIFELVDEKYAEQKDFAADIGVAPARVSEWRNRKSLSYNKYLPKIAVVLGTTTDYLVSGSGPKRRDQIIGAVTGGVIGAGTATTLGVTGALLGGPAGAVLGAAAGAAAGIVSGVMGTGKSSKLQDVIQPLDLGTFRRIPILGRVSAGLPLYAEQHIEGFTVTDLNGGAEYFALIVRGDSMNAIGICDGYRVLVRRQDEVENGQVAVVMVGDEDATVKRVYATGTTVTLLPQSTNPAHQPQIYDPAKTPVRIIGRVVRVEHDL